MRRKLVIEDSILYEDDSEEVRVHLIAYEGDVQAVGEFTAWTKDDVGTVYHIAFPVVELLSKAAEGSDALVLYVFHGFVKGRQ